jgi:glutamyl-tRNA synthetase
MERVEIAAIARKHALLNAAKFDGTAQTKAVIGKVMAEVTGNAQDIVPVVRQMVAEVNKLSLTQQREAIAAEGLAPRENRTTDQILPPLPYADQELVVTRFPPEPNGYLHIGHAKAAVVDYEYAQMYNGRFILRFDDTNPAAEAAEFYDVQRADLRWLSIEWDQEYRTSDNLQQHYDLAERLIQDGFGYICTCDSSTIKENRRKRLPCRCRDSPDLVPWEEFFSLDEGSAILRLKGDMTSNNTAMRDPTLFRIIDHPHPIHGTKYRVWPTYDFTGAVEDSLSGVTHPFRTKEYELRDEVYFYLLDCLGLRKPHLMEFARLAIEGMPVSKRKIKPLIEKHMVNNWDDPRLPTLRGLSRRGILPSAIKEFVLSQGISKAESTVTFDQIEACNRKQLDPIARRFFFVSHPVKLTVIDGPTKNVNLPHHPSGGLGFRTLQTSQVFYIPKEDASILEPEDTIRLKDLYNVTILETGGELTAAFAGTELFPNARKIQWVGEDYLKLDVLVPGPLFIGDVFNPHSLQTVTGYAEPAARFLHEGDIVQFERFGFVRMDNGRAILAHK